MSLWSKRAPEERALLGPSFLAILLWQAANGYEDEAKTGLPFDVAFLVLPIVLHRETRELLPKTVSTSLAFWLNQYPLICARIADRARVIVPFTKEAIVFGGIYGLLSVIDFEIIANLDWQRKIRSSLKNTSDEVRVCAKQANFTGRWFARAGSSQTVMALLGVRP